MRDRANMAPPSAIYALSQHFMHTPGCDSIGSLPGDCPCGLRGKLEAAHAMEAENTRLAGWRAVDRRRLAEIVSKRLWREDETIVEGDVIQNQQAWEIASQFDLRAYVLALEAENARLAAELAELATVRQEHAEYEEHSAASHVVMEGLVDAAEAERDAALAECARLTDRVDNWELAAHMLLETYHINSRADDHKGLYRVCENRICTNWRGELARLAPPRLCATCQAVLVRRPREAEVAWIKWKYCSNACRLKGASRTWGHRGG